MARILVVADDLTGANATGARFARAGMRTATVTPEQVAAVADEYDVVVANLDSRHLPPEQAADLVTDVVEAVWPVDLVVKRVDSTLRGNVGAEVEAAWRAVRERVPERLAVRALAVPAFPATGRVTVDGVQLLDGVPLESSEVAADPFCPMDTGLVSRILGRQTGLAVRHVPARQVTRELLVAELTAGDEPIVLCDAADESRIEDLAEAAAEARRTEGVVWVSVDPGPAGAALGYAMRLRGRAGAPGPLLAVVGSTTGLTRRQLETVARTGPVRFVDVDPMLLAGTGGGAEGGDPPPDPEEYTEGVAAALRERLSGAVFPEFVVVRATAPQQGAPGAGAALRALPRLLAEVVAEAVRDVESESGAHALPTGLYLSGGDLAASLLDELGVHSFTVAGEIVPLAVHGTIGGGPLDGVPAVTKGGLVGDATTAVECFGRLRRAAQARLHQVNAEVPEHILPKV